MASDIGLDLDALHALRRPTHDRNTLVDRIGAHLDEHDGFVSYSGGKDSLAVLDLTLAADRTIPVVFFDSGLEFPETRAHLCAVQDHYGIEITTIASNPPLLELLAASGTWNHTLPSCTQPDLKHILIEEPAARAHQDYGAGHLWGVRAAESRGRHIMYARALTTETMASCRPDCCATSRDARRRHGGVVRRADGTTAYGPIWDWTANDVWDHIRSRRLPVNPLYAKLTRLGAPPAAHRVTHVLDGLKLEEGRASWLARGWPNLFGDLAILLPRLREFL